MIYRSSRNYGHLAFQLILFTIPDCPPLEHSAKGLLPRPWWWSYPQGYRQAINKKCG